jgi:hypothetical protein
MRFQFDRPKSGEVKRKHGVSLAEAQESSTRCTWLTGRMMIQNSSAQSAGAEAASVPSFSRSGTTMKANTITWSPRGKRPRRRSKAMPKMSRARLTADEIADKASRGEDVSAYFTNKFTVVRPVRRVNVDLTQGMLRDLDERAARLNVSRQAVIKSLLDRALQAEVPRKSRPKRKAG